MAMGSELNREMSLLESERKMSEMALKGHQAEMARKLNGALGKDMLDAFEKKNRKPTLWRRLVNKFDRFLVLMQ